MTLIVSNCKRKSLVMSLFMNTNCYYLRIDAWHIVDIEITIELVE